MMDKLHPFAEGKSRQEFIDSMHGSYTKACESKKEPAFVYDRTETYRRIQPKVKRNALCSCGSGKKYKKCCGK